jgi:hypothetical protein
MRAGEQVDSRTESSTEPLRVRQVADMRLRHKASVAIVCFTWAQPGMTGDWAPRWVIEGDPTLSTLASRSELDSCLGIPVVS